MAIFKNQQGWLPEQNNKDCSLGFCTIYCPQWCYPLFPPSPPFSLTTNFRNHATTFSPLLITIITILATFSLLITYHKLISKLCRSFYFRRSNTPNDNFEEEEEEEESGSEDFHQESWHLPPSTGLDESLIRKITVCKYKRGEGLVEGTECSVCLSEFIEDENLRLLPKCSHAFHIRCIDTWLKWHSNCPLCRVNILLPSLGFEEEDVVIVVRDFDLERSGDEVKEAKDHHRLVKAGSSRRGRGERGKVRSGRSRGLHAVLCPVRMKRSVSSGRSLFARQGRGRALLLPV